MITSIIAKMDLWNAWLFMSVFVWQMIIILFANKQTRQRTHVPKEARKSFVDKNIGLIANLVWLFALIYSVFLPLRVGTAWFYIGVLVFILGVLVLSVATSNFITTPADHLIEKSVYRLSRHPMYLATFLICFGTGFAAESWIFILLSVIMVITFHFEALLEERICLDIYKDQYRKYMNKVPRWFGIPKLIH